MNNITLKINNIIENYEALNETARESFVHLKTKDFVAQKESQIKLSTMFGELANEKKEVEMILSEEAKSRKIESLKLREYMKYLDEVQRKKLEELIKVMLETERRFRDQLKMNIEIAATMKEVHESKMEAAMHIIQRENGDKTGPVLFDKDY